MSQTGAFLLGTAGEIEHGKTALLRALTQPGTDRPPLAREQGISIELGSARYEIEGWRFGVIDVPGYERFLLHMLAGVHGIDLVLIVVAADDGIRPRTEEHFDIVHLLGVRRAIFVITKLDLAAQRVTALRSEIAGLVCGTRFESAPILAVSSLTGEGIAALRAEIARQLRSLPPHRARGYFRLPIDHAFPLFGQDLTVTGTAMAGTVRIGDVLTIRPGDRETRVRSLQIHGEPVAEGSAGQRLAVEIAGISAEDVKRGQWLTDPRVALATDRFDAWLEVRGGRRPPLRSFDRVRVHVAAAEVMGRAILLDERRELGARESGFAQIALEQPLLISAGDRFLLRNETAPRTAGGGIVVHPFAQRHRPGEPELQAQLERLRNGDLPARLVAFLELLHEFAAPTERIAQGLGETVPDLLAAAHDSAAVPLPDAPRVAAWTTAAKWQRLGELVVDTLAHYHRAHPLEPAMDVESLRSRLRVPLPPRLVWPVVERLAAEGRVVRNETTVRLPSHRGGRAPRR